MEEELRKCKSEKVMEGGAGVTNGNSGKKRKLQTDSSQLESHEVNLVCPAIFETSYCSKDHESSGFVKENLSSTDLKVKIQTSFQTHFQIRYVLRKSFNFLFFQALVLVVN